MRSELRCAPTPATRNRPHGRTIIPTNLLLLGASARAAASSALRAGLSPWCLDLFADRDLRAMCPARRLRGPFPDAFLDEIGDAPPGPWLYAGGLENHPALVAALAKRRPLWGNDAGVLVKARDPAWLAEQARACGLDAPRLGAWPPGPGRWVVKPVRSGGGRGVRRWSEGETDPAGLVVQEFIDGEPLGVVYCGDTLLGASRQLIGTDWLGGDGFLYCGSVGPVALPERLTALLAAFGRRLASEGLRGLYGVDGVRAGGRFWPVELNPRYTASVEVLERASGLRAMAWNRAAFEGGPTPDLPAPRRVVAKGILYARRPLRFPAGEWPAGAFADVPDAGEPVEAGAPILTLFADGADEGSALAGLRERARGCGL